MGSCRHRALDKGRESACDSGMTRRAMLAICSALPLFGQSASAFGRSMLITNDDTGKPQKIKGVLRAETQGVRFDEKKAGTVFEAAFSDTTS